MKWYWTWSGRCFGYQSGNSLRTHDGYDVGRFHGEEIYGEDGRYLGEVKNEKFLITCSSKKHWRKGGFTPYAPNVGYVPFVDYVGFVMYAGYEDFPPPESFAR